MHSSLCTPFCLAHVLSRTRAVSHTCCLAHVLSRTCAVPHPCCLAHVLSRTHAVSCTCCLAHVLSRARAVSHTHLCLCLPDDGAPACSLSALLLPLLAPPLLGMPAMARWPSLALAGSRWLSLGLVTNTGYQPALAGSRWLLLALGGSRWLSLVLKDDMLTLSGPRWLSLVLAFQPPSKKRNGFTFDLSRSSGPRRVHPFRPLRALASFRWSLAGPWLALSCWPFQALAR